MTEHYDYMTMLIGDAADLSTTALDNLMPSVLLILLSTSPTTAIDISIHGYDDDPRELWDIPEARAFILEFAKRITGAGIPLSRFLPSTVSLITTCDAALHGRNVHPIGSIDIDTVEEQIKAHQERVKRGMI